jgi:hypothetical protein
VPPAANQKSGGSKRSEQSFLPNPLFVNHIPASTLPGNP